MNDALSSCRTGLVSFALLIGGLNASAIPIENWKVFDLGPGFPPAAAGDGLDTDSPTFGDGSSLSAANAEAAGLFGSNGTPRPITLSVGETLTVSATLKLTGGVPFGIEYRLGIFDDAGQHAAGDNAAWAGGFMHVAGRFLASGNSEGSFLSLTGNAEILGGEASRSGVFSGDSALAYEWSMSITRDSPDTVDLVSTWVGGDGNWSETITISDHPTDRFTYTAMGVLIGRTSQADLAEVSNASISVVPEPASLATLVYASVLINRRRRI